jgi:hypothetical protein
MNFTTPTPWPEALRRLQAQDLLPTTLTTDELAQLPAALRERAFFSARVTNADFLQQAKDLITRATSAGDRLPDGSYKPGSYMNLPTFRLEMKNLLSSLGYQPDPSEARGGLQDLSSDPRLQVIFDTNLQMAQGYGNFVADQDPDRLDAWPAQELYRLESRKVPRDWVGRWLDAGGTPTNDGRMIALKNDPIWSEISDFKLPYPPFAFGSGMWVRDISRSEAQELGIIAPNDEVPPADLPGLNAGLQASVESLSPDLQTALASLGYTIAKGILTL